MQKTWSRSGNQMVMSTALEKVEREIALRSVFVIPTLFALLMLWTTRNRISLFGAIGMIRRIYMVIEYVENGQVMYYDPSTYTFYSRKTRRSPSWF